MDAQRLQALERNWRNYGDVTDLIAEVRRLQAAVDASMTERQAAYDRIAVLIGERDAARAEVRRLEERDVVRQTAIANLHTVIDALRAERDALTAQIDHFKQLVTQTRDEVAANAAIWQAQQDTLTAERDAARQELALVARSPVLDFHAWLETYTQTFGPLDQNAYSLAQAAFFAAHPGRGPRSTLMTAITQPQLQRDEEVRRLQALSTETPQDDCGEDEIGRLRRQRDAALAERDAALAELTQWQTLHGMCGEPAPDYTQTITTTGQSSTLTVYPCRPPQEPQP